MVGVGSVGSDHAFLIREDAPVEPQAVSPVVKVDRRQRRVIGDVERHNRLSPFPAVRHSSK